MVITSLPISLKVHPCQLERLYILAFQTVYLCLLNLHIEQLAKAQSFEINQHQVQLIFLLSFYGFKIIRIQVKGIGEVIVES